MQAYDPEAPVTHIGLGRLVTSDPVAFVTGLCLLLVWSVLVMVVVDFLMTGRVPRESPSEIALGMLCLTSIGFVILSARRRRITRVLTSGLAVRASLERHAVTQWVVLGVVFSWEGRQRKRTFFVPGFKRARDLTRQSELNLRVDPSDPGRVFIADLYRDPA
jgi:hypothetical protein